MTSVAARGSRAWRTAVIWAGVLVLGGGCGVEEYDAKFNQQLVTLKKQTTFDRLGKPELIRDQHPYLMRLPSTPPHARTYLFRLPRLPAKKENTEETSATTESDADTTNDDYLPTFLRDRTGVAKLRYWDHRIEGRRLSVDFYLAVFDKKAPAKENASAVALSQAILRAARIQWPEMSGAWSGMSCETPSGGMLPYLRLQMRGEMPFMHYASADSDQPKFPGKLDLYLHDAGPHVILWGVRVPDELDKDQHLVYQALATAGTLTQQPIEKDEPEVKPDGKPEGKPEIPADEAK